MNASHHTWLASFLQHTREHAAWRGMSEVSSPSRHLPMDATCPAYKNTVGKLSTQNVELKHLRYTVTFHMDATKDFTHQQEPASISLTTCTCNNHNRALGATLARLQLQGFQVRTTLYMLRNKIQHTQCAFYRKKLALGCMIASPEVMKVYQSGA